MLSQKYKAKKINKSSKLATYKDFIGKFDETDSHQTFDSTLDVTKHWSLKWLHGLKLMLYDPKPSLNKVKDDKRTNLVS